MVVVKSVTDLLTNNTVESTDVFDDLDVFRANMVSSLEPVVLVCPAVGRTVPGIRRG